MGTCVQFGRLNLYVFILVELQEFLGINPPVVKSGETELCVRRLVASTSPFHYLCWISSVFLNQSV